MRRLRQSATLTRMFPNAFGAVFFALALLCAAPAFAQQSMEEFRAKRYRCRRVHLWATAFWRA